MTRFVVVAGWCAAGRCSYEGGERGAARRGVSQSEGTHERGRCGTSRPESGQMGAANDGNQ
eukprot:366229-Chlamydomonas_euryale.AAC.27